MSSLIYDAMRIAERASKQTLSPIAPPEQQQPEIIWFKYIKPSDPQSFNDCLLADEQNLIYWEVNRFHTQAVLNLLQALGENAIKVGPPTLYVNQLLEYILSRMTTNSNFKQIIAMYYLREKLKWRPYEDFDPEEAIRLADAHAAQMFIDNVRSNGLIDITEAVGKAHTYECWCENLWNGKDVSCMAQCPNLKLQWTVGRDHSFLRPQVKILKY